MNEVAWLQCGHCDVSVLAAQRGPAKKPIKVAARWLAQMKTSHASRFRAGAPRIEWTPEVRPDEFAQEYVHLGFKKRLQATQHEIPAIGCVHKERRVFGHEKLTQGAPLNSRMNGQSSDEPVRV